MRLLLISLFTCLCFTTNAQNTFTATIKDEDTNEALTGASAILEGTTIGALADINGKVTINNIPNGEHTIAFSFVGYETQKQEFVFPLEDNQPIIIYLESGEELETVYVSATRSSRSIENIPTRMEVITAEELDENAMMNSANISQVLRESSGVMVQQTSANSANQSIRIQGLDGKYTQLLKDGLPLYSGYSGGLSIMQVPPLDLKQVEVIKGSSSTLYGGGAIAGLINLVSKEPDADNPELSFMVNQTSAKGTAANLFWNQRFKKTGASFYAAVNNQDPYDPDENNFSDIPKIRSININPKFFWYPSDRTKLWIGINTSFEDRIGGDLDVIAGNTDTEHSFSEENISKRLSSQINFEHELSEGESINLKNSVSYFNRGITLPYYAFEGEQITSFTEANWTKENEQTDWIIGINLLTDQFIENTDKSLEEARDYDQLTVGVFAQNNWDISELFTLESGFRLDYSPDYGAFPLPRISMLIKPTDKITARIGGGLGYKLPTIFNEEMDTLTFQNVNPIDFENVEAEKSAGVNLDINYKTTIGENFTLHINQLFFNTKLTNSLVLNQNKVDDSFYYSNANGSVTSKGFETNVKFGLHDFSLYLQYVYTDVKLKYNDIVRQKPLTPKHNAGTALMYEAEGEWRIGYELYYIGHQYLTDYTKTQDYWMMGFMAMRQFKHLSIFINFENFTDARLSKFQELSTTNSANPTNYEIWAPTDGFVANAGFIIKLFGDD